MQECTARTRATLVSFGERMSTRIFSSYLRSMGIRSTQHDAFDQLGFVTTDEFENGNILDETYPNVASALTLGKGEPASVAVVTGFLGRGQKTGAIATLGRGGSDLTATVIGAALNLPEVYVWKDAGTGSCPRIRGRWTGRWRWRSCRFRRRRSWRTSARRCCTRSPCARRWTRTRCACG